MSELQKARRALILRCVLCAPFIVGACFALSFLPGRVTVALAGTGIGWLFDMAVIGPARRAWLDARPESWRNTAERALDVNDGLLAQVAFWHGVAVRQRAMGMGDGLVYGRPRSEDPS